jgi:hypothetical protein
MLYRFRAVLVLVERPATYELQEFSRVRGFDDNVVVLLGDVIARTKNRLGGSEAKPSALLPGDRQGMIEPRRSNNSETH